jgi:hypothetical protein
MNESKRLFRFKIDYLLQLATPLLLLFPFLPCPATTTPYYPTMPNRQKHCLSFCFITMQMRHRRSLRCLCFAWSCLTVGACFCCLVYMYKYIHIRSCSRSLTDPWMKRKKGSGGQAWMTMLSMDGSLVLVLFPPFSHSFTHTTARLLHSSLGLACPHRPFVRRPPLSNVRQIFTPSMDKGMGMSINVAFLLPGPRLLGLRAICREAKGRRPKLWKRGSPLIPSHPIPSHQS